MIQMIWTNGRWILGAGAPREDQAEGGQMESQEKTAGLSEPDSG